MKILFWGDRLDRLGDGNKRLKYGFIIIFVSQIAVMAVRPRIAKVHEFGQFEKYEAITTRVYQNFIALGEAHLAQGGKLGA